MSGIEADVRQVKGFRWFGKNIGIKDHTLDLGGIVSSVPCQAAAVFTQNTFPGAAIRVGKKHVADGSIQAVIVNSKNANVATGHSLADSEAMCVAMAKAFDLEPDAVFPSSTGVIGQRLPIEKIQDAFGGIDADLGDEPRHIENFAQSIMTTDIYPKWVSAKVGSASIVGIAKGSGMIEPNMATMLAYFVTDADIPAETLQAMLSRIVNRSFNRISVDSDTSTSDSVLLLANGKASSPVKLERFEQRLEEMAIYLAKEIARDGEGATKLVELTVSGASNSEHALLVAKSVINSPLVKTAIAGADPNWGRLVMAVGKVTQYPTPLEDLIIYFGKGSSRQSLTLQKVAANEVDEKVLSRFLSTKEVFIEIVVGSGPASETVWGCDLTQGYVEINAEYTT